MCSSGVPEGIPPASVDLDPKPWLCFCHQVQAHFRHGHVGARSDLVSWSADGWMNGSLSIASSSGRSGSWKWVEIWRRLSAAYLARNTNQVTESPPVGLWSPTLTIHLDAINRRQSSSTKLPSVCTRIIGSAGMIRQIVYSVLLRPDPLFTLSLHSTAYTVQDGLGSDLRTVIPGSKAAFSSAKRGQVASVSESSIV